MVEALKRGAHVYKNISCVGKTDMILELNGKTLPIDVKASTGHASPAPGVSLVHVDVESLEVRWGRPRTIKDEFWQPFWS